VSDARIVHDNSTGAGHEAGQLHEACPASEYGLGREARRIRDGGGESSLFRSARQQDTAARSRLGSGDCGEALRRPAPSGAFSSGMNDRGAGERGRCREAPRVEAKAVWVGRNSALGQQPTPALNLVFLLAPFGQARAFSDRRMLERHEAAWPRLKKDAMARRTPSMEIDSHVRAVQGLVERSVWSR